MNDSRKSPWLSGLLAAIAVAVVLIAVVVNDPANEQRPVAAMTAPDGPRLDVLSHDVGDTDQLHHGAARQVLDPPVVP